MSIFSRKTTDAPVVNVPVAAPVAAGSVATLEFDPATSALADVTGDYTLDATHTRIGFSARHAMVTTVRGQFDDFEGTAHLDLNNPAASSANVRIKVASVSTGQEQRDAHLRTGDFFDSEAFPEIVFVSTKVEKVDEETLLVTGDLTIKDVTRPVTVEFTLNGSAKDIYGNVRVGFEGAATISRKDWGLSYNAALETGGVLISDKIKLQLDVSAIAAPAA
jgi:polyisoprenoid-binding protein YceI